MKYIKPIKGFDLGSGFEGEKDLELTRLYRGIGREFIEINLRNKKVLSKHTAPVPIAIGCIAGRGVLNAGPDLDETFELQPGQFVTLEANVLHEVSALPDISFLLIKFLETAAGGIK